MAAYFSTPARSSSVMEIAIPMLQQASQLADRHVLRAYDAVQLAAAVELNAQWIAAGTVTVTLVSADQELNAAALAEGLTVDDPNMYPWSRFSSNALAFGRTAPLQAPARSNDLVRSFHR